MPPAENGPRTLTIEAGADYIGMSETKFKELVNSGEVELVRHGRWVRVLPSELDRWLMAHQG